MKEKVSVNGLANIGKLLDRNPEVAKPQPPKSENEKRTDVMRLVVKTLDNMKHAGANAAQAAVTDAHNRAILTAFGRDAYNLGRQDALDQNGAVEALLNKQYQERSALTLPAAVAAIMEQVGMSSLVLDLPMVATVFKRVQLKHVVHDIDEPSVTEPGVIEYTLVHLADEAADDARWQMDDIQQTIRVSADEWENRS